VVAYRTVPTAPPAAEALKELEAASAVVFASPSAVEAYVSCRTADGGALPVPRVVACIGPVTADGARAAGLEVAVVAQSASGAGLVEAMAGEFAGHGERGPEAAPH
jgi:uroporphyrinogen-III synthase